MNHGIFKIIIAGHDHLDNEDDLEDHIDKKEEIVLPEKSI